MNGLPIVVRLAGKPVILVGEGEAADAKRILIERAGGHVVGLDDADARLAIVTADDDTAAESIVADLRTRGVLVNAVDRPGLCDFTLPAIVDRSPLLVAISTGGASAGLAAAVRQRLELLLPASLGPLATALQNARVAMRTRWPDGAARRRALGAALSEGAILDPLRADAVDGVEAWLADRAGEASDMLVTIRLRSDDPDDLTLGEARALAAADTLFHRPDMPPAILARARADAARIACDAPPAALPSGLSIDLERAA
ncbi:precorrin-2 dehydrogenase/sirohydrochlorin ferrochelatase family protein [Sphingomonas sp. AX6]|uniref:precorrin-2 dehydrogenase/sirohydrochlorin ferrochelatase family protein n=1 Tax=Sphingomonas sp. AX6 TaxID=2653171 RepID=UPI0012EEFE68|nr:NAD(P)-dependent oxidoreductase [Sphingomonas sp. AX6]VXC69449.1 Siroheme synthase / Precorrin-2 oxidase [Sphingomonas sp. AX6]